MVRLLLIAVLICSLFTVSAQEKRKFQLWNLNSFEGQLSPKTKLAVSEKIQYTPGNNFLDLKSGDVFLKNDVNNWLEVGSGIRMSWSRKEYGYLEEQRAMLYGDLSKTIKKLTFSFSNRAEYRMFSTEENHFRHKQKFNIEFPALTPWNLCFYTAEETFYKLTSEKLHIARWYAGIQAVELKHLQLKMYYVYEKHKSIRKWDTVDIFGMNMKISY